VIAVLDWELCTTGNPLADLAYKYDLVAAYCHLEYFFFFYTKLFWMLFITLCRAVIAELLVIVVTWPHVELFY
jgi:hypothetical protein